jgi:hypothetical protein
MRLRSLHATWPRSSRAAEVRSLPGGRYLARTAHSTSPDSALTRGCPLSGDIGSAGGSTDPLPEYLAAQGRPTENHRSGGVPQLDEEPLLVRRGFRNSYLRRL